MAGSAIGIRIGRLSLVVACVVVAGVLAWLGLRTAEVPWAVAVWPGSPPDVAAHPPQVPASAFPAEDLPCAGEHALAAGDYRTAYGAFSRRGNEPSAAFQLAAMYRDGLGVERNPDLAIQTFLVAAEGGHRSAMTALGRMFAETNDGHSSYPEALDWYTKAALRGDAEAAVELARMLAEGRGSTRDPVAALAWLYVAIASDRPLPTAAVELRAALLNELDDPREAAARAATAELTRRAALEQASFPTEGTSPCAL